MASYVTDLSGVRALIKLGSLTDTSRPSDADMGIQLARANSIVDVALAQGGATLPIPGTSTQAIENIRFLIDRWLAYLFMSHPDQSSSYDPKAPPFWASWGKEFEDALKQMREGKWNAAIASSTSSPRSPWSPTMDAPSDTDPTLNESFRKDLDL